MRKHLLVVLLLLLPAIALAGQGVGKRGPGRVADEIIVKFATDFAADARQQMQYRYGLQKKRDSLQPGAFSVFRHADPQAVLAELKATPGVVYAEQNAYAYASAVVPNDPYYSYQWNMQRIGVESAWEQSTGAGAVVAVIDTGVRQSLQDLAATTFLPGYDFVNRDTDPDDDEGHGSHVCGTIAQSTGNDVGVAGIAYRAGILPVKVLDQNGSGTYDDIADGIIWAADQGADIINLSLGGATDLQVLREACEYAWSKGVLLVVAAGNESSALPSYPAAYEVCLSVSAVTSRDGLASYSNYGSTIDIAAPGGDVGDYNGDGYDDMILQNTFNLATEGYYFYQGTSMAAPHVAGVAALVKGLDPAIGNAELRSVLESTAEDIGAAGRDDQFGSGLLDAAAAVAAIGGSQPINMPPQADFAFTVTGLQVAFADASLDPDGTVLEWSWDFGDGAVSSQNSPEHTYQLPGAYLVTLVASDDGGAVGRVTKEVVVYDGSVTMGVAGIALEKTRRGRNYQVQANIDIVNSLGTPVAGATVSVVWSGAVSSAATAVTDAAGRVVLLSPRFRVDGTVALEVVGVVDDFYHYDPASNVETSETLN